MRVLLELIGLAEKQKLGETNLIDLSCQFTSRVSDGTKLALDQVFRPIEIISAAIFELERAEERIVFQPSFMLNAELLVDGPQIVALAGFEVCPCSLKKPDLEGDDDVVVNHVHRKIR